MNGLPRARAGVTANPVNVLTFLPVCWLYCRQTVEVGPSLQTRVVNFGDAMFYAVNSARTSRFGDFTYSPAICCQSALPDPQ